MSRIIPQNSCLCGEKAWEYVFAYKSPPQGENIFKTGPEGYYREIHRCRSCGHFVSVHVMTNMPDYDGAYVDSAYGSADGILKNFNRINSLSDDRSDNCGRVECVLDAAKRFFPSERFADRKPSVLDVGSGLCVFLYRMKAAGWDCTALDPDARAIRHAQETVGVKGVKADFLRSKDLGSFDLITFNKVLEHVEDPIQMLSHAATFLRPGGMIYIEVPDGEAAAREGFGREEFFIEHHHAFSKVSLEIVATRAGFSVRESCRLVEPSTKYTLRAFSIPTTGSMD